MQEVEAEKAQLEAKAKVLTEDSTAFKSLEGRSREALRALHEKGLEMPQVMDDEGPPQLLPYLVMALEGVVDGIGPMVEGEAHALSSSALMRVFSHLHLCNPGLDLGELLEPVEEEQCAAPAVAVEGQVEAMLKNFLAVEPAPSADGAANPATKANDAADGDSADGKALPDNGAQG